MIRIYNEELPEKPIKIMDELPRHSVEECIFIKNKMQNKIDEGENPFDIVDINCFLLNNYTLLPTLNLKIFLVNDALMNENIETMKISDLLIKLGLDEKIHIWYFWQFETIKECVMMNDK